MARYGLFGDSYIKKLYRFCDGDLHVPGSSSFVHRGGLRCDRLDQTIKKKMKAAAVKTDFIFLSIGSNDISPISDPEHIFNSICNLVKEFQDIGVHRVYISGNPTKSRLLQKWPTQTY